MFQLHSNGSLDATSVAALGVHLLPKLLCYLLHCAGKIDHKVEKNFSELKPILEQLCILVASTPGLQQCTTDIENLLATGGVAASETLLLLLTALDALPLEQQVAFFNALYVTQESHIASRIEAAKWHKPWLPTLPMEHEGVTCDGCAQKPLTGLRFKCATCPDFDLCAECFTKRSLFHRGECSAHEFDIVPVWGKGGKGWGKRWRDLVHAKAGKGFGKGLGTECFQGKSKGKGKRFCKGGVHVSDVSHEVQQQRPCLREGCRFAATWHPTHCCEACRAHGNQHGLRCQQVEVAQHPIETQPDDKGKSEDAMNDKKPLFEFTFPVEVEDGRRLTISWNRSDNLEQVAADFANEYGIASDELPTIKAFLEHATSTLGPKCIDSDNEAQPTLPCTELVESDFTEAQKQLEEMGLGHGEVLLELLKSHGGSVQRVIEELTKES